MDLCAFAAGRREMVTRERALLELAALGRDTLLRIVREHGLEVADVQCMARQRQEEQVADCQPVVRTGAKSIGARRQLAQLWLIIAAVHSSLEEGCKMTQRELWYRLKTTGMFATPVQVNDRILDVCAALSCRIGAQCPRQALGVLAAPRGSLTGCITLLREGGAPPQPLNKTVYQVPGDTELIHALRFDTSDCRARCVLVVEKDSIFRRLVDDRFCEGMPSVLITACGYPDLATRSLVRRIVDTLGIRAFALTDYNPHGIALMLTYKHGSANHALEHEACTPSLQWLGLRSKDVLRSRSHDHDGNMGLPADAFQHFTSRDHAVLAGLTRRAAVRMSSDLMQEVEHMQDASCKVEIEALYCHGFAFLSHFIRQKILTHDAEHCDEDDDCRADANVGVVSGCIHDEHAMHRQHATSRHEDNDDEMLCDDWLMESAPDEYSDCW